MKRRDIAEPGSVAGGKHVAKNPASEGKDSATIASSPSDASAAEQLKQKMLADSVLEQPDAEMVPLGGGVSSDVYLVTDRARRFVVKQALPNLKVKDRWQADVARNISERDYLTYVGKRLPGTVPALRDAGDGYFLMEYLGDGFLNWKDLLLAGECNTMHAAMAGKVLGTIHRLSYEDAEAASLFDTTRLFHQLRTDPYLLETGRRHPELQQIFRAEAKRLESTRECLVHGDYSPKNMLLQGDRLVVLDCETAWYGDPAFDLAFLLSHLLLKGLYHSPREVGAKNAAATAVDAYFHTSVVSAERRATIDERTARLVLLLLLARVDGKSPVEYLTDFHRQFVQHFVAKHLQGLPLEIGVVDALWFSSIVGHLQTGTSK